jgi:hypothetical protein
LEFLLFEQGAFSVLRDLGAALVDGLYGRGDDGRAVLGVVEFEAHAAADEARLQHGAAPGGAGDRYRDGAGTEFWMPPEQGAVLAEEHCGITMMLCLDKENRARLQIVQEDAAFDFRLYNVAIDLITEVGVGPEHLELRVSVHESTR